MRWSWLMVVICQQIHSPLLRLAPVDSASRLCEERGDVGSRIQRVSDGEMGGAQIIH